MRTAVAVFALAVFELLQAGQAEARMTSTQRQLAVYDCGRGDVTACEALVRSYPHLNEGGLPPEDVDRVREAAKAEAEAGCSAGDMRACTDYGSLLAQGGAYDAPEVYAHYAKGCDGGDGFACGLLSDLNFALGSYAGPSYAAFYELQAKACETGDKGACTSMSRLNVLVPKVLPDKAIWFDQLRRLCDDDMARACALLSYIQSLDGAEEYDTFDPGWSAYVERRQRYALRDAEAACRLGNPVGCLNAGLHYDQGQAVVESWKRAQSYYAKACKSGFSLGCEEINYETYWRPSDNRLALRKACEEGDFSACHYAAVKDFAPILLRPETEADRLRMRVFRSVLRLICQDGWVRGCSDVAILARAAGDIDEADRFATAACTLSAADGCLVKGNILKLDRGGESDLRQAIIFHKLACDLKSWTACNNLGDSYERGMGVTADVAQAARHYSIACAQKVALGCKNMAELKEADGPEEAVAHWERACALDAQYCREE